MVGRKRLDIAIPTYNRADFLDRNLDRLRREIATYRLSSRVSILVSDNGSDDDTGTVLERHSAGVRALHQGRNIGLEANVLAVLGEAREEYVLFLGDDDFLPPGYLARVVALIDAEANLGCVVPGIKVKYPDGRLRVARPFVFPERRFPPGYWTALRLAHLGHQLSGLVVRREGLIEAYAADPSLHNIYLFVFFVGYSMLRGVTWYLSQWEVEVTEGNPRHWSYDGTYLVSEAIKNYRLMFPHQRTKELAASGMFVAQQAWRLGVGSGVQSAIAGCARFLKTQDVDWRLRVALPLLLPLAYGFRLNNAIARLVMRTRRSDLGSL